MVSPLLFEVCSSTRQEGEAQVAESAGLQGPGSRSVPILRGQCPKTCHGCLLTADTRLTVRGRKQKLAFLHSPICSPDTSGPNPRRPQTRAAAKARPRRAL